MSSLLDREEDDDDDEEGVVRVRNFENLQGKKLDDGISVGAGEGGDNNDSGDDDDDADEEEEDQQMDIEDDDDKAETVNGKSDGVEGSSAGGSSSVRSSLLPNGDLSFLQGTQEELTKRQRSNAKAVDVMDMGGNLITQYRSGLEAMKALGVSQGDISLCCRGLKSSIGGYKFRFIDEGLRITAKLKRGYMYDDGEERKTDRMELLRTTRASRGDYASAAADRAGGDVRLKSALLAPADLKTQKWRRLLVKIGNLVIPRWVPEHGAPTTALQEFSKLRRPNDGLRKRKRLSTASAGGGNRQSFSSHEVLGIITKTR